MFIKYLLYYNHVFWKKILVFCIKFLVFMSLFLSLINESKDITIKSTRYYLSTYIVILQSIEHLMYLVVLADLYCLHEQHITLKINHGTERYFNIYKNSYFAKLSL